MLGRIFRNTHSPIDSFLFWFCVEICIDLFVFFLIRSLRRRDTGVTSNRLSFGLKGTKKRLNKITLLAYPRAYMIFTELMWSMYSVAMLLRCALSLFGEIYCPFNYGVVAIFALPRIKKPPDLVSEGDGHIRCSRSLFASSYDSRYDYYIARQRFMAKKIRMHQLRKAVCTKYLHRVCRPGLMPLIETSADRLGNKNEKQNEKFNLCETNDIPLDDAHHENTCDKLVGLKLEQVITLKRDFDVYQRLKDLNWLKGDSVYLTEETAQVLRDTMESSLFLASGLRLVIIDTGASLSISNDPNDFLDGFEHCDIKLQGIGSGLRVIGKGKVRWRFQRENGGFVIVECMAYYAPEMKFNLFSPQSYLLKENEKVNLRLIKMVFHLL